MTRMPRPTLADLIRRHARRRTQDDVEEVSSTPTYPLQLRARDWLVVDAMSLESEDFVLLRRVRRPGRELDSLTARERQVVRLACGGASNKEIAYQIGVRAPTVRVLLWRACKKVGAADRKELIRLVTNCD